VHCHKFDVILIQTSYACAAIAVYSCGMEVCDDMSTGPHISDEELIATIERIAEDGITLKASCVAFGFEYKNVLRRIRGNEALKELLAVAREAYAEALVAEMHDIARTEPDVQRAKLMCENIRWEAARVGAKLYGDKISAEVNGTVTLSALLAEAVKAPAVEWSPPPRVDRPVLSVVSEDPGSAA
jgi:hypothetical protein